LLEAFKRALDADAFRPCHLLELREVAETKSSFSSIVGSAAGFISNFLAILFWAMSLWIGLLAVVVDVHRCDVTTHQREMALPKEVLGVL